jgi:hypothetical protein
MQLDNYDTDLLILPETDKEYRIIKNHLFSNDINFHESRSNIENQSWYGKRFIEVPFMANADELKEQLIKITGSI